MCTRYTLGKSPSKCLIWRSLNNLIKKFKAMNLIIFQIRQMSFPPSMAMLTGETIAPGVDMSRTSWPWEGTCSPHQTSISHATHMTRCLCSQIPLHFIQVISLEGPIGTPHGRYGDQCPHRDLRNAIGGRLSTQLMAWYRSECSWAVSPDKLCPLPHVGEKDCLWFRRIDLPARARDTSSSN